MHSAQSGGRSSKPLNGSTSTPHLKPGSDIVQNSATSVPSLIRGKKRERCDQSAESVKGEHPLKTDNEDSGYLKPESVLKADIARILNKGGLIDFDGVEKLVQLMQSDRDEKKIDLVARIMLVDVIAATDRFNCLDRFLQLRGLPVLDEWLQEVHKGKIGDGSGLKENDRSVEEFLLALLRALDKLPVDLHALQTCNVGKSVNLLRSHRNLEIQKKARSLVDTWKKRVDAEMKINDAKSGLSRAVSWPTKSGFSEISHGGNRRTVGSSEVALKSSITQPSVSKTASVKLGQGEAVAKSTSASPGSVKFSALLPASINNSREEKSSSSSQSQNNSLSCSSDHAKTGGSSWKEDARSSTAGSLSVNKISSGVSRHRKSNNGLHGSTISGIQKETGLDKSSSLNSNLASEKVSQSGLTSERMPHVALVDNGNSQRLIVRFPNPGRSPARRAVSGPYEDPSVMVSRASSPAICEKHVQSDQNIPGKPDVPHANISSDNANISSDVNTESWQSNDVKDGLAGFDEGDGSPAAVLDEQCKIGDASGKVPDASKATCSSSENEPIVRESYEASLCSINALIESCVKYSEASVPLSVGDNMGMNLLASVATGEMSRFDLVSPIGSPARNSSLPEDSCMGSDSKLISSSEGVAQNQSQPGDGAEGDNDEGNVSTSRGKYGLKNLSTHRSVNLSGVGKTASSFSDEKPLGKDNEDLLSSIMNLQKNMDSCSKYDEKLDETKAANGVAVCHADMREDGAEGGGARQICERRKLGAGRENGVGVSPSLDENQKVDRADEKIGNSSRALASNVIPGFMGDGCDIGNVASSVNVDEEAVEESALCPSLKKDDGNKNILREGLGCGLLSEQKRAPVAKICPESVDGSGEAAALSPGRGNAMGAENVESNENSDDPGATNHAELSENQRVERASNVPPTLDDHAGLGKVVTDDNGESVEKNLDGKVLEHRSGGSAPHGELLPNSVLESEKCMKISASEMTATEADETENCASTADAGSDMAAKLNFDLNEGFPVDVGDNGESVNLEAPTCTSGVHLPSALPFLVSSMSSSLPASITVAAAAKGPFFPPEILPRSKGELGWKGSAATSAFRPAEPRKVLEMQPATADSPFPCTKQGRPPLDIDLNVPDERVLEDIASQSSAQGTGSESRPNNNHELIRSEILGSSLVPVCSSGGLDFDLNILDEGTDAGQYSASTSGRLNGPFLPVRPTSDAYRNGEVNVLRDFDLNDGPGLEEVGAELSQRSQHGNSSVPFQSPGTGFRTNNTGLENLSSWFPPGNYSAVTIPSILPDRGEQHYPIFGPAGTQRVSGPLTGGATIGFDVYSGQGLSSSPAMAFPSVTSYQHPGLPFGSSFPLPSSSFSGGSATYVDSSGGALCFPAVPSQLVGPAGVVSSHYPRPYVTRIPDGASNAFTENCKKWGRQGLDLNAGPGGTDVEGRDERLSSSSRQLFLATSPALAEEQARLFQASGGVLKRKEPEGGWDISYKQPSRR